LHPNALKLARYTIYNLVGLGLPLSLALVSIPVLVQALGPARFGLLALIWAVTSYFGLFDLGLSRALTQALAAVLSRGDIDQAGRLAATALLLMAGLGGAGGVLLGILAPWGVDLLQQVPDRAEAIAATRWMAAALPFIVITAGLRGMLEACHAFGVLNAIRLPMGLWTFAGPWLAVVWGAPDLGSIALALAIGRLLGCAAHVMPVLHALPQLRGRMRWDDSLIRPLARAGGWLSLSNVVSPFMGYVDRFVAGATVSAAAVAWYATPQELVLKLWIVPGALTAVLLPIFAARRPDARRLFGRAVLLLLLSLTPICAGLFFFAEPILAWWITPDFAAHSAPLLRVFAIGILINCLAHMPLTWLHGLGRFRAPALVHLVELPLYLLALWMFTMHWGLMGAAWAWLGRMTLDALALFALTREELRDNAAHG